MTKEYKHHRKQRRHKAARKLYEIINKHMDEMKLTPEQRQEKWDKLSDSVKKIKARRSLESSVQQTCTNADSVQNRFNTSIDRTNQSNRMLK